MKVGILCSDITTIDMVTIYKVLAISDVSIFAATRFDITDPEDITSVEGMTNWDTYIGINGQLDLKAGTLIEFPEPINTISVDGGTALVYFDDISLIPEF